MKRIIFTLFACCLLHILSKAQEGVQQYCGNSGPAICTPTGTLTTPGFYPLPQCLNPVYVDSAVNFTLQFRNYDTTHFGAAVLRIDSIQFDTISNLPSGLCWATNKPKNRFSHEENGCITISGTVLSTDTPGQYQLYTIVSVWAEVLYLPAVKISTLNFYNYIRLKSSPADVCERLIDTTGEAAGTNMFISYGAPCDPGTGYIVCTNYANDAALTDIISPTANYCGLDVTPTFKLVNDGLNTLTKDSIFYQFDGGTWYSYFWTGNLNTGQSDSVILPIYSFGQGNHSLRVYCTSPNDTIDENIHNDTLMLNFTALLPPVVGIEFLPSAEVCFGGHLTVIASGGVSYVWANSLGNTAEITVTVDSAIAYVVTATGSNNCSAVNGATPDVYPLPLPQTIIGNHAPVPNQSYTYTVNLVSGDMYQWDIEGGTIESGQGTDSISIIWGATGPYVIAMIETDNEGCSYTNVLNISATAINEVSTFNTDISCDYLNGTNIIRVSFGQPAPYSLKLYEITGGVVMDIPNTVANQITVPNNLAKGIYIAEIFGNEVLGRRKILIR